MNQTMNVQPSVTRAQAKEQLKQELAHYLEQQSESMRTFHRWMKGLEWASVALTVIVFIVALVVSINWTNVPKNLIPTAWFALPGSFSSILLLLGLHTIILKASPAGSGLPATIQRSAPPTPQLRKNLPFVTGREAVGRGWAFVIGGLLLGAFWGLFAYAAWTLNWAILTPMITFLGVLMGVAIVFGMILTTVQKISKMR